ncbi:MAG: sulfate adenylyltransferase subunit CysD [Alphaproteobacteria bacterium]|nr:sulfate adenylyltransferase subunit CysD [Alphaproteobacteria bacterium]
MSQLTPHLQYLEEEAITIIREAVAAAQNPVFLYSIGKDSGALLHLIMKAYYPVKPPLPMLHVDTRWKFREMIEFRDTIAKELGFKLHVFSNPRGEAEDIGPFSHGARTHTQVMKTDALKLALNQFKFDFIFIGARRDEEKSRAKERIFSLRNRFHAWDPKNQRPEFGLLFNTRLPEQHSMRVAPLSNWTEYDVWQYIRCENIPMVPLYFAKERPVVIRDGQILMVDDDRFVFEEGDKPVMKKVRFRTLGCYPLTGAIESDADTLDKVIAELEDQKSSERAGRLIDHDSAASMEKKKKQGYF